MSLQHIRMELAREEGHPEGSSSHGYEFNAPLDEKGMLDLEEWREKREDCTVVRFWNGEEEQHGHLTHNGTHWRFHYPHTDAEEGEPIFRLSTHPLFVGDYLSVTEDDGEQHTFKIVHVRKSPLDP